MKKGSKSESDLKKNKKSEHVRLYKMLQNAFILIFFVICNVSTIFKFHYNNSVPPFSILIQLYSHSSSCKHSGRWQTRSQVPPLDPPQHARCPSQGSPSITQKTCLKQKKQIPPSALPICDTGPFEHSLASVSIALPQCHQRLGLQQEGLGLFLLMSHTKENLYTMSSQKWIMR